MQTGFFNKLSLNKIYKYILYVSGIVLILSLFLETKVIEQNIAQGMAIRGIIVGIILWFAEDIFHVILATMEVRKCSEGDVSAAFFLYYLFVGLILFAGIAAMF